MDVAAVLKVVVHAKEDAVVNSMVLKVVISDTALLLLVRWHVMVFDLE